MRHAQAFGLEIQDVKVGQPAHGYEPVTLVTADGNVDCRYYPVPGAVRAAIWVGGAGGGWDSPGRGLLPLGGGLYPRLAENLTQDGIASLRVRYRHPAVLDPCVLDVLTGLDYLMRQGIAEVALIGWSFGGAVVIQAAAVDPLVRTVVTVATQSYGADAVSHLAPRCSILFLHGTGDRTLPPSTSEFLYRLAGEPKRLVLYPGADHALNQVANEALGTIRDWISGQLPVSST